MQIPFIFFSTLLVSVIEAGCSASPTSKVTSPIHEPRVSPTIAVPCPFRRAFDPVPRLDAEPPKVIVELATVEVDLGGNNPPQGGAGIASGTSGAKEPSFSAFINGPNVNIPSVMNILVKNDVPYDVPSDLFHVAQPPGCPKADLGHVSLTAHMKPYQPTDVRLDITVGTLHQEALREGGEQNPDPCRVQTTVTVKDQQTIILGGFTGARFENKRSVLVVTPYIIWHDDDLHTLLECKRKLMQSSAR